MKTLARTGKNSIGRKARIEALFSDLIKDLNEMEALEEGIKAKLAAKSSQTSAYQA